MDTERPDLVAQRRACIERAHPASADVFAAARASRALDTRGYSDSAEPWSDDRHNS